VTVIIAWSVAAAVLVVLPSVVCALKRRWAATVFGALTLAAVGYLLTFGGFAPPDLYFGLAFVGPFVVGGLYAVAVDLARPDSRWAQRFYDEDKRRRAELKHLGMHTQPGEAEVSAMRNYGPSRFSKDGR
jgi:hypothetical protein